MERLTDGGSGTAGEAGTLAPPWPKPPTLSTYGKSVLAAADKRDQVLMHETGHVLHDLRAAAIGLHHEDDAWNSMVVDAARWRHYWLPEQVVYRAERELAARRRLAVLSSHQISALWRAAGGHGPAFVELQRLRSIAVTPWLCGAPGCIHIVSVEHPLPADMSTVRCHTHRSRKGAAE